MADDKLTMEGIVVECRRGDLYEVEATIGSLRRRVLARRAGRLVQNRIKIVAGDLVTLEVSPYDMTRGRITFRGSKH